ARAAAGDCSWSSGAYAVEHQPCVNVDQRLASDAPLGFVPGADAGQHREDRIGRHAYILDVKELLRRARVEDRAEAVLVLSPQCDDLGAVVRFEAANLRRADEDFAFPLNMIGEVKRREGFQ